MALCKLGTTLESGEDRSSNDGLEYILDSLSENTSVDGDEMYSIELGHQAESKRLQTSRSLGAVKRVPRRRPDPNTFNRNALMARENRKKKKEYMENLEKQVICYKSINRKLKKLLNQQSKVVKQLKDESKYYRSVLANKTQIISLINAVKSAKTTTVGMEGEPQVFDPFTYQSIRTHVTNEDYNRLQEQIQNWDSLLDANELSCPEIVDINTCAETQKQVTSEHNYSNSCSDDDADSGVCLHVSSGKISLKFCAACHKKSTIGLETVF